MNDTHISSAGKFAWTSLSDLVPVNTAFFDTFQLIRYENSESIFNSFIPNENKEISGKLLLSEQRPLPKAYYGIIVY
jgi:hypothetical protein